MTLLEIIHATVERMRGVEVKVDISFSWVSIDDAIFLQGHEADEFIDEAKALREEAQHVTIQEVYLHLAEPYAECLN